MVYKVSGGCTSGFIGVRVISAMQRLCKRRDGNQTVLTLVQVAKKIDERPSS
ncbi:unnamed protein product [Rhodiola kirilowii]